MVNELKKIIDDTYNILFEPIDNTYKLVAIENYKQRLNLKPEQKFGEYYYSFIQGEKSTGVIYTPEDIGLYIVKNTISKEDIIKNPFIKIIDPSCGSGNLIMQCFNYLRELYKNNIDIIREKNGLLLRDDEIDEHILKNNLYGFDIDDMALKVLIIDLFLATGFLAEKNFINADFLIEEPETKFDVFIGNPPYVGQKSIDKSYSKRIKKLYKNIYKDKGDLSYCFFQASLNRLNKGGKISFITSRYFLEAPSGAELRKTLKETCSIYKIIDFYGIRPFKGVGIDPLIIFLTNDLKFQDNIETIKPLYNKGKEKRQFYNSVFLEKGNEYNKFMVDKKVLNSSGWILIDNYNRNIINKIERKCITSLSNICSSYQGIITGCDKAFVVDSSIIKSHKLEEDIIKRWIKSSYIGKNTVKSEDSYIIYADLIKSKEEYPNCLNFISAYKDKLAKRRECEKGIRKWYELQWGRKQQIFENRKIIFPYKSSSNRFAMDKGSYFSADVYSLAINEDAPFTYDYILFLLNSKTYEFYFKTFAKKLGEDIYEYYPNNLMKLCVPTMFLESGFNEDRLYEFFEFTDEEKKIINDSIG